MTKETGNMNVAYVLSSTLPNGGATKAFLTMLHGLMRKGVQPLVVLPDGNGVCATLMSEGIDVVVLNYRPSTYTYHRTTLDKILFLPRMILRFILNYKAASSLKRVFAEKRIQIAHTNVSIIEVGRKAAKSLGIPHIIHFREYGDLDFGFQYFPTFSKFHKEIKKQGDYSICITREIQEHHSLKENARSRVIYDPVVEELEAMPAVEKDNYILYAGRVQYTKGLDILLEAYNAALRRHQGEKTFPRLKVAGSFAEQQYVDDIKEYITSNNLNEYIDLLGECNNIKELMSRSRALIIPSRFEGFGLCMPEAMSEGCLCAGYDNAGTKEQFDNGEAMHSKPIGYRFKSQDELTDFLLLLASAPDSQFEDMRRRAFATVQDLYSTKRNADEVYTFYKEIIKGI